MSINRDRLLQAKDRAVEHLLNQRNAAGHWSGELSTSALSTATAVMALHQFSQRAADVSLPSRPLLQPASSNIPRSRQAHGCRSLIERGISWLLTNQNGDGGWGDTSKSFSNISTTMLCHATLVATRDMGTDASFTTLTNNTLVTREEAITRAARHIEKAGGIPALIARYGKDKTFSVPILTHCALAGLVPWGKVPRLPFELACIPASWYAMARFPVVSYALPALIAIGQVRHFHGPTWNPVTRSLRWLARDRSLKVLEKIQPPNGGFLEAAPLTSFVCMSLASMGLTDHPVVQRGIDFLMKSVRPDGSWPIDTNLATWVTTLSVNALGEDLPEEARPPILKWLLKQQYQITHPYTNAEPGGWAWTDLPGGVPDADDTPGAILALGRLETRDERQEREEHSKLGRDAEAIHHGSTEGRREQFADHDSRISASPLPLGEGLGVRAVPPPVHPSVNRPPESASFQGFPASLINTSVDLSLENAVFWLLDLQNRDGGFPTFCRGWGTLPFDRSSPDITAHCLRAIWPYQIGLQRQIGDRPQMKVDIDAMTHEDVLKAVDRGFAFLERVQRSNGSWLPLWFGNQHVPNDENPVYGTSRVLRAFRDCDRWNDHARRGAEWLRSIQNPDGGWGGDAGAPSTVEETALALDALLHAPEALTPSPSPGGGGEPEGPTLNDPLNAPLCRGVEWLIARVEDGTWTTPSPIGFYFAKLWYYEALYPVVWTVAALRKANQHWHTLLSHSLHPHRPIDFTMESPSRSEVENGGVTGP